MADQISIQIAEPQVAAGSAVSATVNFRTRSSASASTPSTIRYRAVMRITLALLALLCAGPSFADEKWVFDFELGYKVKTARAVSSDCHKLVVPDQAEWYVADHSLGTVNCGGSNPVYNHFLGRKIGQPLPRLRLEIGWRHMSHYGDSSEIFYDALAIRGRFEWGR